MRHLVTHPLPTLPTEVIEEVIDQASDDPRSLQQLTLLCKPLLTRARLHLFTGIVIRSVEQMVSSREFLDSRPWVPPLVQRVTLSSDLNSGPESKSENIPLIDMVPSHLLARFPNVRTWRMEAIVRSYESRLALHRSTLLCYQIYGGHVQELELEDIPIQDVSHFVRLVSAFSGLQRLTCYNVDLRRRPQSSLLDSEVLSRRAKALKIQYLSIDTQVDIRLLEYLLSSSVATLKSLTITFEDLPAYGAKDLKVYFKRLDETIHRLSRLSSLTLVILSHCRPLLERFEPQASLALRTQWATMVLESVRRAQFKLKDVWVQFKFQTLADLGCAFLSGGGPASEACQALETSLLAFPRAVWNIQFHWETHSPHRAGRSELWSPTIASAFPKLDAQGLLTLPRTCPSDPRGHEASVTCLVASPDSKWFATTSYDGTTIIWDTELGTPAQEWLAYWGAVRSLGISPDGLRLVTVSAGEASGESLVVWDLRNGVSKVTVLATIDTERHKETTVFAVAWSPDSAWIASVYEDGTVRLWDALTFQQRVLLSGDDLKTPFDSSFPFPWQFQWSSDSRYLAWIRSLTGDSDLDYLQWTVWRLGPFAEEPRPKFHQIPVSSIATSNAEDFDMISAVSFDPQTGRIAIAVCRRRDGLGRPLDHQASENVFQVDGSSDGHWGGYVEIRDVMSGTALAMLGHAKSVFDVSFSPDGRSLLSRSDGCLLKIWDTESWQETASLEGDGDAYRTVCVSPDGKYVAAALDSDATFTSAVQVWRVGDAAHAAMFTEHKTYVEHVAFSPNGEFLASGDMDGLVHIRRLSDYI